MNKYQEAYKRLSSKTYQYADTVGVYEDIEVLGELVEKEIPKVPLYEGDGYADGHMVYDTWVCPNCGKSYELESEKYKRCPECGQLIDWSEEEWKKKH